MKLQPFTLIGATTAVVCLTAPTRVTRFVNREHLDFYTTEELSTIISCNSQKLRTEIAPEAAHEITCSRGTPRKANNWLRWTRDFADARANGKITLEVAAALKMKGVDDAGLGRTGIAYLETIINVFSGGPAGVQALGHTLNIPADTLEDEVEPFLLREGFIQRTPRGRMITAKALASGCFTEVEVAKSQRANPLPRTIRWNCSDSLRIVRQSCGSLSLLMMKPSEVRTESRSVRGEASCWKKLASKILRQMLWTKTRTKGFESPGRQWVNGGVFLGCCLAVAAMIIHFVRKPSRM